MTNFKKVSDIHELEINQTSITSLRNEGWTLILIKQDDRPAFGTYRCKVLFMEGTKHKVIESEKVYIEEKKGNFDPLAPFAQKMIHSIPEKVKFQLNHGHERFHKGDNIKMECKYKLLKKDKFAGLSLTKDKQEFFTFYDNKNRDYYLDQND